SSDRSSLIGFPSLSPSVQARRRFRDLRSGPHPPCEGCPRPSRVPIAQMRHLWPSLLDSVRPKGPKAEGKLCRRRRKKTVAHREQRRFQAIVRADLAKDIGEMSVYCVDTYPEQTRDVAVGFAR